MCIHVYTHAYLYPSTLPCRSHGKRGKKISQEKAEATAIAVVVVDSSSVVVVSNLPVTRERKRERIEAVRKKSETQVYMRDNTGI